MVTVPFELLIIKAPVVVLLLIALAGVCGAGGLIAWVYLVSPSSDRDRIEADYGGTGVKVLEVKRAGTRSGRSMVTFVAGNPTNSVTLVGDGTGSLVALHNVAGAPLAAGAAAAAGGFGDATSASFIKTTPSRYCACSV